MNEKMTHEQVNAIQDSLRDIQRSIEDVGAAVCDVRGDVGPKVWGKLNALSEEIAALIHETDNLRPWD